MAASAPSAASQHALPTQLDRRYAHLSTIFGHQTRLRIQQSSVLVVGAGGIGCELLKNLVQTGFGNITIVDLDTVDTSNLNRQFLFQKRHVKRPKAIVARETASTFNPHVSIDAFQANILDPEFDQAYFLKFDLVLNALDNLTARRHVNKMCVATKVPLIESGTAGYTGQVQPIRGGEMECYDCQPKPLPKTFPVCTIRSTPSTPIHCIVWAKSYLFTQLFGPEDENEGADLDEAIQNGESAKEVENLRAEVKRMKEIRAQLQSAEMSKTVFKKVFEEDIQRLLMMEDMWKHRVAPVPLDFDNLASQEGEELPLVDENHASKPGLKDQQALTLKDSFDLFCSSLLALGKRIETDPAHEPLSWDKDDDEALDFVTAAANLRATVFGIPQKTRFEVKEMAGNIIPAIATTNSAVSALIVFQAINILTRPLPMLASDGVHRQTDFAPARPLIELCRPWYGKTAERVIMPGLLDPPSPQCPVCQVVYATVQVSPDCTLGEFLIQALQGKIYDEGDEQSVTVQEGDRLLYDPDFVENGEKSFKDLGLADGLAEKVLRVTEEAERYLPILFTISKKQPESRGKIVVKGLPETIPRRPAPEPVTEEHEGSQVGSEIEQATSNGKRIRDGEPAEESRPSKKVKVVEGLSNGESEPIEIE